jgi:hypothetical protein
MNEMSINHWLNKCRAHHLFADKGIAGVNLHDGSSSFVVDSAILHGAKGCSSANEFKTASSKRSQ